jgi:hypothetical protein
MQSAREDRSRGTWRAPSRRDERTRKGVVPVAQRKCVREGTCYPTNHVSAFIDRRAEAEEAAEALHGAGFNDVSLFHGEAAYQAIHDANRHDSAFARAWRRIRDIGDEGALHQRFLLTLRLGGSCLIVYADSPGQAHHAHDILAAHHAHDIWRLGAWTVEQLT